MAAAAGAGEKSADSNDFTSLVKKYPESKYISWLDKSLKESKQKLEEFAKTDIESLRKQVLEKETKSQELLNILREKRTLNYKIDAEFYSLKLRKQRLSIYERVKNELNNKFDKFSEIIKDDNKIPNNQKQLNEFVETLQNLMRLSRTDDTAESPPLVSAGIQVQEDLTEVTRRIIELKSQSSLLEVEIDDVSNQVDKIFEELAVLKKPLDEFDEITKAFKELEFHKSELKKITDDSLFAERKVRVKILNTEYIHVNITCPFANLKNELFSCNKSCMPCCQIEETVKTSLGKYKLYYKKVRLDTNSEYQANPNPSWNDFMDDYYGPSEHHLVDDYDEDY